MKDTTRTSQRRIIRRGECQLSPIGSRKPKEEERTMTNQDITIFGIDLGTTFSCIAYVDEYGKAVVIPNSEGDRTTPSVVQFEGESRVVGKEAKNSAVLNPR